MRVIGTAGHVDHGKSTLVQAITGIHPDRLKEEREREMTIDLGFAWFTLPDSELLPGGEEVGIVDVPGHRDFIDNMLSGVGGIDAALFVVDANEGVMPQTREHLAILDILQIRNGVVALTKCDLVEDEEWLDLVEEDLRHLMQNTVLEKASIIRVSAKTGAGIPELLHAISVCLADFPPHPDLGRPRLPVDRVFSMPGFGTVVTGTLLDGSIHVGDEVAILSSFSEGLRGRVRGLQTHKKKVDMAVPGSRTAINISGVTGDQIQRGDTVIHPGDYKLSRRMDVHFRLLPEINQSLRHNVEVKFYVGASETVARVRLLGMDELLPGNEAFLQLELDKHIVGVRGDRYILRRPSPGETLGGGVIIDSQPVKRHKRYSEEVLSRLQALYQGTPLDIITQSINILQIAPLGDVINHANLEKQVAYQSILDLLKAGDLLVLEGNIPDGDIPHLTSLVTSKSTWLTISSRVFQVIKNYHQIYPLRRGMPKEELKSHIKTSTRVCNTIISRLSEENQIQELGPLVFLTGHDIQFNQQQGQLVENLLSLFRTNPYAPPSIKDCISKVGEEIYSALVELGEFTPVSSEIVFRTSDFEYMVEELKRIISQRGNITAAEVRNHFNTSRRYVLAFLEFLDTQNITIREGDTRRLKN